MTALPRSQREVIVLAGSLRHRSVSAAAGLYVAEQIRSGGIPARLLTVAALDFPPFNPDIHRYDGTVCEEFLHLVRQAPAMVWVAPAYNGIVSGSFKNVLDYLDLLHFEEPMFLTGKAIGIASTSSGLMAAVNTNTALDMIARSMRGYVIPYTVQITNSEPLTAAGDKITDERVLAALRLLVGEVTKFLRMLIGEVL